MSDDKKDKKENLKVPANLRDHTFDKKPHNINRKGKAPSITNLIKKFLAADGTIRIPLKDVIETVPDSVAKDESTIPGYIKIKLPKAEALVTKLFALAMSGKSAVALKAIEFISKSVDGEFESKKYKRKRTKPQGQPAPAADKSDVEKSE